MCRPTRLAFILRPEIVTTEKQIRILQSLVAQARQAILATQLHLVSERKRA